MECPKISWQRLLKFEKKVLIRIGPLKGIMGIMVRQKNSTRVILTLDLIMRSISVEVDEQDVEVVGYNPARTVYFPLPALSRFRRAKMRRANVTAKGELYASCRVIRFVGCHCFL